jgi:hypothetical protein
MPLSFFAQHFDKTRYSPFGIAIWGFDLVTVVCGVETPRSSWPSSLLQPFLRVGLDPPDPQISKIATVQVLACAVPLLSQVCATRCDGFEAWHWHETDVQFGLLWMSGVCGCH